VWKIASTVEGCLSWFPGMFEGERLFTEKEVPALPEGLVAGQVGSKRVVGS